VITVVVPTLDRAEHLERCLRSILAGPVLPREVIVVDQSAGDATRLTVERVGGPARWVHQAERSTSVARNRGVELAATEYVALLDDDGEVESGWMEAALAALEAFDHPDALFGAIVAPPGSEGLDFQVSTHHVAEPTVWPASAHPALPGFGNNGIVRRDTFLAIGGYDARLGPGTPLYGAEDMDLNYRLLRGGHRVASTPALRMVHHQWRDPATIPRLMYGYNLGHSAFCAKHLRAGDRGPLRLIARQAVDDARMLGSAVRRRSWLRARVAAYRTAGTWVGLARGWRTFG
jgi:glycosyltransferase involved in cell wall biosynthesis